MTEFQERRYVCKICNKSCVSGKSLGGHMRIHLSRISASKKAEKLKKGTSKMESAGGNDDEYGSCRIDNSENLSYNTDLGKNILGLREDDPNSSYELRENPKKSWRISDSPDGDFKKEISCKECGKAFSSLKALSGHMRSHSIKNTELNQCKKCGKGFESTRALYGHMKSHSKRSRVADDPGETLSDLENLCPVRKKRSSLRNKVTPNPSFSSLNDSSSEFGEVDEAAMSLMMISRGVRNLNTYSFVNESSVIDSGFCGAKSFCRSEEISGKKNDGDKVLKVSESVRKLDSCISDSANAVSNKDVSSFDNSSNDFVGGPEMELQTNVSGNDDLPNTDHSESAYLGELGKGMAIAGAVSSADLISLKYSSSDQETVDAMTQADLAPPQSSSSDQETIDAMARAEIVDVYSLQALGVSKFFLKQLGNCTSVKMDTNTLSVVEANCKRDGLEGNENANQESIEVDTLSFEATKSKGHKCTICFMFFSSGQDLAGHKKAHFTESKAKETMAINQELPDVVPDRFDLNSPATADEDPRQCWARYMVDRG